MDNTNRLELVISIKDDGSVVIDTVKKKTDDLGQVTKQASAKGTSGLKAMKAGWLELAAGVTAGYFTIKKGIDVITGLINVAAEAEEIEKRAAFQMETWGYKFQEIKPYVDAFANSIQQTTRFSDEMARQSLGNIMKYTSSVEEGMKGARLAMDFATQSNMDLQTAIRYVGMAIGGNVEPLGRYILELRDLDKILGEDATSAEKTAYFFELFNKKFSGAAQKDLQTYAGQLANLKNQWFDLKESMGFALMPGAEKWIAGTQSILKAMEIPGTIENRLISGMKKISAIDIAIPPLGAYKILNALLKDTSGELAEYEAANQAAKEAADAAGKAAEGHAAKLKAELDAAEAASMRRDPDRWKKWVEEFDFVAYALDRLGVKSTAVLSKEASDAVAYAEVVKKAFQDKKASVRDYVNALNVASDAMKKLTGEDLSKKREEAWDKNAETIKGISKDEEGWLKKVNKANDELFKTLKEIDKLEVPTHADVGPMEREVNAMKEKLRAEGLIIPVTTEGATGEGGGYSKTIPKGNEWMNYVMGGGQGGQIDIGGMGATIDRVSQQIRDAEAHGFTIPIYGEGSSRKPITEKIREIIGEFGGLEKAMSGMEAEINVAELSLEYNKLDAKLNEIEQAFAQTANMMFMHGYSYQRSSADQKAFQQVTEDLMGQMKILQMKMGYERLKAYGGSYQTGIQYVPQTGLYTLHEGERITPRNVSSNITIINHISGADDPHKIADNLTRILKYRLNGELSDLLRK